MQSPHLGVASHDGTSKHKRVYKKCSGVNDHCHCGNYLFAASWIVHSLVEYVCDARICGVSKTAHDFPVDHKLSLLVRELQYYRVSLAGIQETKWFGSGVWPAEDGWIFLHSGRLFPSSEDVA